MSQKYISDEQFETLLEEIKGKISSEDTKECEMLLQKASEDVKAGENYIDRTYIGEVRNKKRLNRITEIRELLEKMSYEQVENVHGYAVNEFDEPNHEAVALDAIVKLSREKNIVRQS